MLVGTAEALQPVDDFLIRYIIRILCKYKKVEIVAGVVCADHVHLCESVQEPERPDDGKHTDIAESAERKRMVR